MLASRPSSAAQQPKRSIFSRSVLHTGPKVLVHGTNAQIGDAVDAANAYRGAWVERGKDWMWGNQDGGQPGQLLGCEWLRAGKTMWRRVRWPATGITALYRVGEEGCHDLKIASEPAWITRPRRSYRRSRHSASTRKLPMVGAYILCTNQAAIYPQFSTWELENLETAFYGCMEGYEGVTREQVLAMQQVGPGQASFGVELELLFPTQALKSVACVLQHAGLQGPWRVGYDGSIDPLHWQQHAGLEVASPPLQGLHGLLQLYRAMEALQVLKPVVNTTTGFHIHIGCDKTRRWGVPHLRNLVFNCVMLESALDEIMPLSRRCNRHCQSLLHVRDLAEPGGFPHNVLAAKTRRELAHVISPEGDKHYKINLWALLDYCTVEFRQPAGTTNPAEAVAYVLLYLRLVEASKTKRVTGSSWGDLLQLCGKDDLVRKWLIRRRKELRRNNNSVTS